MPRQIVAKASFAHAYAALSDTERHAVDIALGKFQRYLDTGEAPVGLGIKRLGGRTHEFRVNLTTRIVCILTQDEAVLVLLGSHDEIRRFLRRQ